MDFSPFKNESDILDLRRRIEILEQTLNRYTPTVIEASAPGEEDSDEPPPLKQVAVLAMTVVDVEGSAWTDFEDCDGNTFKVQTRDFTAG